MQLTMAAIGGTVTAGSSPRSSAGTGGEKSEPPGRAQRVRLFLGGDVMVGRGIDQILPHPGDPRLYEDFIKSSLDYVELGESAFGPVRKPVDFSYVWGDGLAELDRRRPDVRIVNLETAVTRSADPALKGVNYKINPDNFGVVTAARIDCCNLANNHVLDWGSQGLLETLETLEKAGVKAAGAGRNRRDAAAPAILPLPAGGRVLVFGFGSPTSGVPRSWAATEQGAGVNFLSDLSQSAVRRIGEHVRAAKERGDIAVASIHWGSNWGYEISPEEAAFAHGLIDEAGIDVVFGHSSHHAKAIEVHRGKLILYGCGDLLDDYEGISGYEEFRADLAPMYFPVLRDSDGTLAELAIVPFQIRHFRLNRALAADAAWLCDRFNTEGSKFGTRASLSQDGAISLAWN